ncbi:MAG: phosphatidylglycerol lysyltransferase domain-containing protein [Bacillota bacterium]|nr:phosphatidylglycerol lysyltransferase domain-containing protein [Bacillota bacterium]
MVEFKRVSIEDKPLVDKFLDEAGLFNGDSCFGNIFAWSDAFNTKICTDGSLFTCIAELGKDRMLINFPLGKGDRITFVKEICDYARQAGRKPSIGLIADRLKPLAEETFGDKLKLLRCRNNDDYVYLAEKLINLSGKDLHSKKNMLNGFLKNEYTYEGINAGNLGEIKEFCLQNSFTTAETLVIGRFFDNFVPLGLTGAAIRINKTLVAATVGERKGNTIIIHVEKALHDVRGAYAAINNLYLKNDNADVYYVNREDDMGHENLRKAKMSYKPDYMVEKYIGEFVE